MNRDQNKTPLYDALMRNKYSDPISFHVPGHKYGQVFSGRAIKDFQSVLQIDATEITGLDDLHAPEEAIYEAQQLTSRYFNSEESFFLVNGTTSGNLAMVLTVCRPGDVIIVQRNCHHSIINGIELAGAVPVFLAPEYEVGTGRFSKVTAHSVNKALHAYPQAKAAFLTYPDYFGRSYPIGEIIEMAHDFNIPVLIDEAHGVHFQLGHPFPSPALSMGADAVVQSAHKMGTAMTMASYLHIKKERIDQDRLRHYLQMLQSSSPSYPLMASLDLARYHLAQISDIELRQVESFVGQVRLLFEQASTDWRVLPVTEYDDILKLTLEVRDGLSGFEVAQALEEAGIYPELATSHHILLTFGLTPSFKLMELEERLKNVNSQNLKNHGTIKGENLSFPELQTLDMDYSEMQKQPSEFTCWTDALGQVAAEAVIPYPPGIPLILKGELISEQHVGHVKRLNEQGARFQNEDVKRGIRVFKGESV